MSGFNKNSKFQESNYVTQKIAKRKDILWEVIDGETVLFDPKNKNTYSLNQMASIIWEMCDGQHTCLEISSEISDVLNVSSSRVLTDVVAIINDLLARKLLETN